LFGSA
jgi:hypothetical protein